jgi:catechol 2,3-dioxygenase-like lactoylglutathione lyase family enzyme
MGSELGFDGGLTNSMQCTDLDASIAWYQETLGFSLIYRVDEIAWCELTSPVENVRVGLSQVESPAVEGGATPTWGVKDIDMARNALEGKSVRFDGETLTFPGMVRLATFFDPDGNKMMLYQDLSGDQG